MRSIAEITSVKNPHILSARELSTHKGREIRRAFLCEGEHMAGEALAVCPGNIHTLFVSADKLEKYAALLSKTPPNIPVFSVTDHVMSSLSQVKTPQGIAAVVAFPKPVSLQSQEKKLVLLENLQDPGNVGTILRTLDAAGFQGCILTPGCADPFAPKTLRATMGSIFRVPLTFTTESDKPLETLKAQGYALLAAELSGEPFYERSVLPEKICLLIGNEGAGLTPSTCAAATHRFRLPMSGGAESLNAAIAAAVMMYDLINR